MNNVDLRDGFRLGGCDVTLVAASNRTTKGISIYTLDPATRRLTDVADGLQATGFDDPYGLCLYRSGRSNRTYAFVNQGDGPMRQLELVATQAGKVRVKLVDRKSVVEGQSVSVRVDLGGRRIIKKKKKK